MRPPRWRAAAAVAAAALALLGCAPDENASPSTSPASSSTPEPTYTDEELLAQARETYEGYLAASEAMAAQDEYDYTALLEYASEEIATNDVATLEELHDQGVRIEGATVIDTFTLEGENTDGLGLSIAACLDISETRYVDESGVDVSPSDMAELVELALGFERSRPSDAFILTQQEAWTGTGEGPCS